MTVHNHPPYEPPCRERIVNGELRGACLPDLEPEFSAPAYLDPLHDELDRLRTENEILRETNRIDFDCATRAEVRLEQAEARVDQLHGNLDMLRATLEEERAFNKQRSDALNRTGASNDQLRATLARVDSTLRLIAPEHITPHGARLIRAALDDQEPDRG